MDQRARNVEIFEDTRNRCETQSELKDAIKKSGELQKFYSEYDQVEEYVKGETAGTTRLVISRKRSFEAAAGYPGKKVCVHNFASATNPGGGVTRGSNAQEECLCRTSTLYFNLSDSRMMGQFYGAHRALHDARYNDDCIYTPGVIVFKDDSANPTILPKQEWYTVNVLTCAAPNLRAIPSNRMNPNAGERVSVTTQELFEMHKKRGRRILNIAKENGNEVVILGAFGCGAFQNPPEIVAEAYRELIKEFEGAFETVEFAVYCSPKDLTNYEVFKKKLF